MEQEIWKPVPGYEGRYEVSNLGRVRSLSTTYRNAANRVCTYPGRLLNGSKNRDGYLVVSLCVYPSRATRRVHTLVCTAFVGARPSENHEVNHKNFDRLDNRAENLEWVLHADNVRHSVSSGRFRALSGKRASNILLTPEKALAIRDELEAGLQSRADIAAKYNCNRHTVNEIARGAQWVIGAKPIPGKPRANDPWLHSSRRRKLTPEAVLSMRAAFAAGTHTVRDLAALHGIAVSTANEVVRNRTWSVT